MKIKLTKEQLKKVINEGWFFNRKKEIGSFQDYTDYMSGIDTTIVVYDEGENYLINRQGSLGHQLTIHTLPKEKFSKDQAIAIALDISGEDNFPNKRESFHMKEQDTYEKRKKGNC